MSWPLVAIGEFCRTGSGGTPSRKEPKYYNGEIPWIKSGDLREKTVVKATEFISDQAVQNSSAKIIHKGAILVAMYGATVGRMAMLGIDAATNQAICSIVPDENRGFPKYVYYALINKVPEFLRNAVGGAQPNISQGMIKETQISLPPLKEQKRIATILDKADAIRRKRQQAIKLADEFLKSVFLDMFGDPIVNPKNWSLKTWGEVMKIINGKNQRNVKEDDGAYPIYGSGGEMGRANDYLCNENTVIIGRKGNINKPILVTEKFWNVDTAFGLEADLSKLSYLYLFWFCKFFDFEKLNKTVTIPSLTKSDLLDIKIPVPDIGLQKEFDEVNIVVKKIIKNIDTSTESITELFGSLSQKAFLGGL